MSARPSASFICTGFAPRAPNAPRPSASSVIGIFNILTLILSPKHDSVPDPTLLIPYDAPIDQSMMDFEIMDEAEFDEFLGDQEIDEGGGADGEDELAQ